MILMQGDPLRPRSAQSKKNGESKIKSQIQSKSEYSPTELVSYSSTQIRDPIFPNFLNLTKYFPFFKNN